MSHYVLKRGKYWEEYESYRDERGRPRKRFLRYLGILGDIDWKATLQGDPEDRAMAVAERLGAEADARRAPEVEKPSELPDGLHVGPTDPVEAVDTAAEKEQAPESGPV